MMHAQVMTADMVEQEKNLRDYWLAFRRRRLLAATVAAGVMVIVIAIVMLWPPKYQSSATILIEQQEIPQDLVRSTITSYADQRIQVLSQQVMTTSTLLDIISRYGLYEDMVRTSPREEVLEEMRDDTRMQMISAEVVDPRSGRPTSATIAFTLSYLGRTPDQALKVTNELTNRFLEKNVESRTETASQTLEFLEGEAERMADEIRDYESRLSTFKADNVGRLPEQNQLNLSLLDRTERDLSDLDRQLRAVNERRIFLEAEVARQAAGGSIYSESGERIYSPADRLKYLRAQLATFESLYSDRHPDVTRTRREIASLEAAGVGNSDTSEELNLLASLQAERNALAARLSASHPDVRDLDRQIAAQQVRADGGAFENDDPGYRQLQAQLAAAVAELQSLEAQRGQMLARVGDYQSRLATTPVIEKDYVALQIELENARAKYRDVRNREMEARLSQNMEADRRGERFTIIEPPLPAEQPASPDRPLLIGLGLVLALGAGVLAIVLAEGLDNTVHDRAAVERLTALPTIGLIPNIKTVRDRSRLRWQLIGSVSAIFVAGCALLVLVHLFFMPLDVLWYASLRRLNAL